MFFNKHLNTSQVKGTVRPVPEPKVQNVYASPQVVTLPRAKPSVPPAVRQAKVIARVLGSVHRQAHTKNVMAWQTREAEVLRELYQRIEDIMERTNPFTWLQWCQFCLDHSTPSPSKYEVPIQALSSEEMPIDTQPIADCFQALQDYVGQEYHSLLNKFGTYEAFVRFYYRALPCAAATALSTSSSSSSSSSGVTEASWGS